MISVMVMAHERRRSYVDGVLLPELRTQFDLVGVAYDDGTLGCWGNARRCWEHAARTGAHAFVVQDDVLLSRHLGAAMRRIAVEHRSADLVSLFTVRRAVVDAVRANVSWIRMGKFMSCLAVMMPSVMALDMLGWVDSNEGGELAMNPRNRWDQHDDVRIQCYLKAHKLYAWATAPCLVDHVGHELGGSLLRHRGNRRAQLFCPDATAFRSDRESYIAG